MNNPTQYSVDWFIQFYSAIPEDRWCPMLTDGYDRWCAIGHLRGDSEKFRSLTSFTEPISAVNDGRDGRYKQPTPKQRVLAMLYDVKSRAEQAALDAYETRPLLPLTTPPLTQPGPGREVVR